MEDVLAVDSVSLTEKLEEVMDTIHYFDYFTSTFVPPSRNDTLFHFCLVLFYCLRGPRP
jgi:hypothetical protein